MRLFSLMDSKPPISRAKMISITKSAIKAMKLYKHVVQIVEKFIKKCKPEYKVAGLYVVDSIVRQSRHQFGPDKDVFGPRFTKNITGTFENLCLCPIEDRSKIVRVLNLWQKNGVFKIEVIQPLLDMAAASGSGAAAFESANEPGSSPPPAKEPVTVVTANSSTTSVPPLQNSDAFAAVAQLFQTSQGQQVGLNKLLDRFDYDDEPETGEETKKDETSSHKWFIVQALPLFLLWLLIKKKNIFLFYYFDPSFSPSVCSTTLWVGQLDKRTQQQDVASLLEEFGQIESINMIPPRGCAYIVMMHRQDAFRALQKLSRGPYKVNQKTIKIAWALNKGIKPEFKQYWDVELGVTCIPWSKVREDQLEELKEGGMLDSETLSPEWVGLRKTLDQSEELTHNGRSEQQQNEEMPALPVSSAAAAPPVQVPPTQQPVVGMGSLQPPVFPGPIGMPPPSFTPGVPPPPFIRPGFNPMQMPPGSTSYPCGFPPPGPMSLGPPPPSKGRVDDPHLDPAGLGNRNNDEDLEGSNMFNNNMASMGQFIRNNIPVCTKHLVIV
uniref:SR-related CTD-associated factor 4a n=1 Tax=Oryzias sinensis TaxID=183150 RepID=A0A8C7XMF8_9TELE